MKYEFLDHTADVKIRTYGKTLEEAFSNLVLAFSEFVGKNDKIKPRKGKIVDISGSDRESLLYNFIDEMIYLIDAEGFVVAKGEVFFRGNNLRAEFYGDDAKNYKGLDYFKAATYSEMKIEQDSKGNWSLTVVIDV